MLNFYFKKFLLYYIVLFCDYTYISTFNFSFTYILVGRKVTLPTATMFDGFLDDLKRMNKRQVIITLTKYCKIFFSISVYLTLIFFLTVVSVSLPSAEFWNDCFIRADDMERFNGVYRQRESDCGCFKVIFYVILQLTQIAYNLPFTKSFFCLLKPKIKATLNQCCSIM